MTRALLALFLRLTSVSIVVIVDVVAAASDTLNASQPLRDGQKIVSASLKFELGFFAFKGSTHRYVGIRYHNMSKSPAVWVANREKPLTTLGGVLNVADDGNIAIVDEYGNLVWGTNMSARPTAVTPVAQLLDSGNLILRDPNNGESGKPIWQSFDHPTDTLLPGMKLGWYARTRRFMKSWKSKHDPTPGRFRCEMAEGHGGREIIIWNRDIPSFRTGAWLGTEFSGMPYVSSSTVNFTFRATKDEVTFSFDQLDQTVPTRLVLTPVGLLQQLAYIGSPKKWHVYAYSPQDRCDTYGTCGTYSTCDPEARPMCACVHGFQPRDYKAWQMGVGTQGCVRQTRFHCRNVGFVTLTGVKLPQSPRAFVDRGISLEKCKALCLKNCSCTAYSNSDISDAGAARTGCVIWFGDLIDIKKFETGVLDLYVKVAASDIDNISGGSSRKLKISLAAGAGTFTLLICLALVLWKRKEVVNMCKGTPGRKGPLEKSQDYLLTKVGLSSKRDISDDSKSQEFELPLFDLNAIVLATNNFSEANKLGQGGFGTVYKGMLTEGQEIAVKRLSQTSGQGIEEFKNEVRLIARLQHRNLVRLLGCCVEMAEKILIYEFMPNNSLDSFIFDTSKNSALNWRRRFSIICGIARGLLYLHQDSRFRVIHRDLKASNILLDAQMIPKISDFGMARIFGGDQLEANTCRVVGTYGYMSPEYAMDGHFSVKSDVFSFGVLVLEIITGKKNRGFYYSNAEHNLLGYAWGLWREGKGVELIDPSIGASYSVNEVLRCLQVGLVCVQERAEDRPTMATVVLMLSSENTILPEPRHPGFCMGRNPPETSTSSSKRDDSSHTINQVTVSVIDPR